LYTYKHIMAHRAVVYCTALGPSLVYTFNRRVRLRAGGFSERGLER